MNRSILPTAICIAALLQAGCADDGARDDERIRVPQLRMVDGDAATPLTLAATDRIMDRNLAAFGRASLPIERTVWVRPNGTDSPTCLMLGRAGPPEAEGADAEPPERGFQLQVDAGADPEIVPPALAALDDLAPGDPVSLLVFWSVRAPSPMGEPGEPGESILLDAAEYPFEKAMPDEERPGVIFLNRPGDAQATAPDDGMFSPMRLGDEPPCGSAGDGPLGGLALADALNPDGDTLDSLFEINAGLPADAPASSMIPVAENSALVGIDVIVAADERVFDPIEPLPPTWRIEEGAEVKIGEMLSLMPSGEPEDRDPLELRVAVTSEGMLVLEVVLPSDLGEEDDVRVNARYSLDPDGRSDPLQIPCAPDSPMPSAPRMPLSSDGSTNGLFLDTDGRVLARCSSPGFEEGGRGIRTDGTFSLLVDVDVGEGEPPSSDPARWSIDGERVLVYRGMPGSGPVTETGTP